MPSVPGRKRRPSWAVGAAGLAVILAAGPATADVKRYALLIGANRGEPHEVTLRYAESDVHAVAETLLKLGGFPGDHIVRLTAPTASKVRGALVDLNLSIQQDVRGGGEAVLFVYYSGHADGQTLHLGGTELPTEEFSKLVRLSPAKLKILLLDACRTGTLTRVKGGRQIAPFQIGVQDQLRNEGYAIITSSAAGEDAQESDALRSSIFTHHFLAALRGPGDANGDGLVTLGEAYGYASEQALKTSMATIVGSQHATFDYDLRGRADPILTDVRTTGDLAQLVLVTPGEYLVTSVGTSAVGAVDGVIVEAFVKTPRRPVLLPPGPVRVRMRTRTNVYEADLTLRTGETLTLAAEAMRPIPLAQVVRKGETEVVWAHGPTAGALLHGPLQSGLSPMLGVQVGWAVDLPRITLVPRLGLSTGRADALPGSVTRHTLSELGLEVAGLYIFDVGRLSLAPMASVGWSVFRQTLELPDVQITRPQALVTALGAWGAWPIGRGFTLEGSIELVNFYLRHQESRNGIEANAPRLGTLTYRSTLGLAYKY